MEKSMAEEKQFELKVRKWIKEQGGWSFKVMGNAFQEAGIPDVIGCINGKLIALEIKSSRGKASDMQLYKIKLISQAGGYARVVSPKNWEQIKKELLEL